MPARTRSQTRYAHASPRQYAAWERQFWADAEKQLKAAEKYKELW